MGESNGLHATRCFAIELTRSLLRHYTFIRNIRHWIHGPCTDSQFFYSFSTTYFSHTWNPNKFRLNFLSSPHDIMFLLKGYLSSIWQCHQTV
ncbi:hypothetical protein TanjilG_16726 [Lupinus angustifolius]|uniref:Uncharacterized protein n=1 Tax=Lupinus angustifolius TaxID=3871 RepID=A0A4P1R060_LUPAN|nr:hypothetical protein TanjilG_16726 [Lupinus angustifolius]